MDKKETSNGKRGGLLKGKPHYDKDGNSLGGIKAVVTDAGGKPVELEGGEVIINKEASKKHWKALSKINQSAGNGVPILPTDGASMDEDTEELVDVTETQITVTAIDPVEATVEQTTYDDEGVATTATVENPLITKDNTERATAQAVVDATPQSVIDTYTE